jgi:DNA replicative helicase MCM subunit Mcm2 (Cdc46/Mcm family)
MKFEEKLLEWILLSEDANGDVCNEPTIWKQITMYDEKMRNLSSNDSFLEENKSEYHILFWIDLVTLASEFPKLAESLCKNVRIFEDCFHQCLQKIYKSKLLCGSNVAKVMHKLTIRIKFFDFPRNLKMIQEVKSFSEENANQLCCINGFVIQKEMSQLILL